jgi:hypothetical protein
VTRAIFKDYLHQPDHLPEGLRDAAARRLPGEAIRVYALSDLDEERDSLFD